MAKKTIKAWAVVADDGRDLSPKWDIAATKQDAEDAAFARGAGWKVLPCTITIHTKAKGVK